MFKIDGDKAEKLIELLERVAACYMPGEWIGQSKISDVDQIEQFEKQVESMYGDHN